MLETLLSPFEFLTVFSAGGDSGVAELVIQLLVQLAVILFAAKVAGELASRFLKVPAVLAELGIGIIIGPFALGAIPIPGFGPLFPVPIPDATTLHNDVSAAIPVSDELFALAQIGSIVLLFAIGLETNLRQFLRYAGPATAVALGGVILPFTCGMGATVLFGFAGPDGFLSPEALFMGAIMTATSVGITARVLSDLNRLDNPEGVTIIAAAVVDDVLGILVLTVVVGINAAAGFSLGNLGWIAFKAIAFWLGLTVVGILVAPYIERAVNKFRAPGAGLVLMVALAFLAAGMAEVFGLAFIIGAFSIGLGPVHHRVGAPGGGGVVVHIPNSGAGLLRGHGDAGRRPVHAECGGVRPDSVRPGGVVQGPRFGSARVGQRLQPPGQRPHRHRHDSPGRSGPDYRRHRPLSRHHRSGPFRRQHNHDGDHHRPRSRCAHPPVPWRRQRVAAPRGERRGSAHRIGRTEPANRRRRRGGLVRESHDWRIPAPPSRGSRSFAEMAGWGRDFTKGKRL